MSENITFTRIVDLPDTGSVQNSGFSGANASFSGSNAGFSGVEGLGKDMYVPMNIHPNPYGVNKPPDGGFPTPQQTTQGRGSDQGLSTGYNPNLPTDQLSMMQEMPNQRLPQRDIPMDPTIMLHDEQIQPNYIPKPKLTADYIQEYQESADRKLREYEEKKHREKQASNWFDVFRDPILISILFFIFHLPIVNTVIFKRFSFLSIYSDDGNFNFTGLLLKCLLFAVTYYIVANSMKYLSEF